MQLAFRNLLLFNFQFMKIKEYFKVKKLNILNNKKKKKVKY